LEPGRESDPSLERGTTIRSFLTLRSAAGPSTSGAFVVRRTSFLILAWTVVAGSAAWYGFLETTKHHPSLKLSGAMVLAGLGIAVLTAAPSARSSESRHGHEHSALVAAHPVPFGLASASISAALIHFAVIEQHFSEYWVYGWFFVLVGAGQLAWAAFVLVRPFRLMLIAGAIGNALVVVAWIVTRTYGSLVGPEATTKAAAGFGDIVSTALEVVLVTGCALLLARPRYLAPRIDHRAELVNGFIAIGLALLTTLSLYSAVGGCVRVARGMTGRARRPETRGKEADVKMTIISIVAWAALAGVPASPVLADVSPTQSLPAASCNHGTMNAHEHIPETTGTGATTPAHAAVPGFENQSGGCGHGG
jgi:hypothetical protein